MELNREQDNNGKTGENDDDNDDNDRKREQWAWVGVRGAELVLCVRVLNPFVPCGEGLLETTFIKQTRR